MKTIVFSLIVIYIVFATFIGGCTIGVGNITNGLSNYGISKEHTKQTHIEQTEETKRTFILAGALERMNKHDNETDITVAGINADVKMQTSPTNRFYDLVIVMMLLVIGVVLLGGIGLIAYEVRR